MRFFTFASYADISVPAAVEDTVFVTLTVKLIVVVAAIKFVDAVAAIKVVVAAATMKDVVAVAAKEIVDENVGVDQGLHERCCPGPEDHSDRARSTYALLPPSLSDHIPKAPSRSASAGCLARYTATARRMASAREMPSRWHTEDSRSS